MTPSIVIKRNGAEVPFERARIATAIANAQHAIGIDDADLAHELARVVEEQLTRSCEQPRLGIEDIQDAVVHVLQESGHYQTAVAYIRYRDSRERFRRTQHLESATADSLNLTVVDLDGRRRPWERGWLTELLIARFGLDAKNARDALVQIEFFLADGSATELSAPLLMSLVDAALVRCGKHSIATERSPIRIDRHDLGQSLAAASDGIQALLTAGRMALGQLSASQALPPQVASLHERGRLWIDGLDDPRRGSRITITVDGHSNPWQVMTHAFRLAAEAQTSWRHCDLVLPASILSHLERGADVLAGPVRALAKIATVYLYCDGRTPLLANWPFTNTRISIATYNDDFLLLRELQARQLPMLSGPHLMQGGYRHHVAVDVALNAQGLDGEYSQMDALAMAAASALHVRMGQLGDNPVFKEAELRFAIFGLPPNTASNEYLDRQVVQEGLRLGLTVQRSSHLTEEACLHLARLLE